VSYLYAVGCLFGLARSYFYAQVIYVQVIKDSKNQNILRLSIMMFNTTYNSAISWSRVSFIGGGIRSTRRKPVYDVNVTRKTVVQHEELKITVLESKVKAKQKVNEQH